MPRDVVPILRSPRRASRQHVELAVVRQDDVRLVADQQPAVDVDAERAELVDLLEQRLRIDDDAVADDAGDAGMQDAGRDQVQDELLARRRTRCGRRCGRPGSAPRRRSAASAGRRSCPCLRRPTARPDRDIRLDCTPSTTGPSCTAVTRTRDPTPVGVSDRCRPRVQ